MTDEPTAEDMNGPDAFPSPELLVGDRGLSSRCPYCDTVIPLDGPHECHNCGADATVRVRWSR